MLKLVTEGYAVASIDYRLGGIQAHPNHIHDCNAAVRWLKAHAQEYGYSVEKVGVAGSSAGGHLALLVGVGSDVPDLQGKVGEHLDQSSRVDAIVDFYGPSDLYALGQAKHRGPEVGLTQAFGKTASPVHFLDANDPPVLIFQGDTDRTVVPEQSTLIDAKYKELGLTSTLHMLKGAGHGGRAFSSPRVYEQIKAFLDQHLKSQTQSDAGKVLNQLETQTSASITQPVETSTINAPSQSDIRHLHGLIWMAGTGRLLPADAPKQLYENQLARFKNNLKNNPHLDGVSFTGGWKDIEPIKGAYTFERLDGFINAARDAKMPYKLVIMSGSKTPDDVFEQGAKFISTNVVNKYRGDLGQAVKVPLPWDSVFQDRYWQFVETVAKRYASDPLLYGVTVTVANYMSSETHLPRSDADVKQWEAAAPDFRERIEQCWKEAIDRFAILYPQQQITLELAGALPGMDTHLVNVVKHGIEEHPGHFVIQNDQLNGREDNMRIFSYRTIMEYGDQVYHGFQTVAGWAYERSSKRQGSMQRTADHFNQAKGRYLEVWYGDGANVQTCAKLKSLVSFAK